MTCLSVGCIDARILGVSVAPDPPYRLGITNTQSTSVLLQFTPGADGHARIIRWIIECQMDEGVEWLELTETSQTHVTSLMVNDLTPYTSYQLRMIAENVAGRSEPSDPTLLFQTMQAPPAGPPDDVTVRAVNETSLLVGWTVSLVSHRSLQYYFILLDTQ